MSNYYNMSNKFNNFDIKSIKKIKKNRKNINELNESELLKVKKNKSKKKALLEELIKKFKNDIENINNLLLKKCEHNWVIEYDDGPENRPDYYCNKCYNYKSYLRHIK